jgi:hypothetical protein
MQICMIRSPGQSIARGRRSEFFAIAAAVTTAAG